MVDKRERIRVAFRADDAGSCESANLAIAEGVAAGTVKNVSVMACGPAIEHAAARLKDTRNIDIGLHVTLNAEWVNVKWRPILSPESVPTLVEAENGYFTVAPRVLKDRGFSVNEAVAEVEAQLDRVRSLGFRISYIDEHMGVGNLPGLRAALVDLGSREGIPHLSLLDLKRLPPAGGLNLVDKWLSGLRNANGGTYLVVTHPGRVAPDMESFFEAGAVAGAIAAERNAERQALTAIDLKAGLDQLGVESVRFSDLSTEP